MVVYFHPPIFLPGDGSFFYIHMHLLTSDVSSTVLQDSYGGYMVAFAGRKYAARSLPAFVANNTFTVTSFTLVSAIVDTRSWCCIGLIWCLTRIWCSCLI